MSEALIIIEHDGQSVKRQSLNAITVAKQIGCTYSLLVLGDNIGNVAEGLRPYEAQSVIVAEDPSLAEPVADRYARVIADVARSRGSSNLLGASSSFSKDILPRCAGLLDAPMLTDITAIEGGKFKRPVSAGSMLATVQLGGKINVMTARATAFTAPQSNGSKSPLESFSVDSTSLPLVEILSREARTSARPDLNEARVVVCGGRPLKDCATFEKLIGGLADALGGAVGATRAAVDAGMAPNDCQIGQTGKVIAPELYIGAGISGSIQHLAGIKDSKVIVAINRDPDAPIFQMATYGLVGDLFEVLPRLIDAVRRV